jgi:hypothetical protein
LLEKREEMVACPHFIWNFARYIHGWLEGGCSPFPATLFGPLPTLLNYGLPISLRS